MKTMKRLGCLLLVLAMCLALGVTAMAEDSDGYTITITTEKSGYGFEAFQILKGDISGTYPNFILSNIKWGASVTEAGILALEEKYSITSARDLADLLTQGTEAENTAKASGVAELLKSSSDYLNLAYAASAPGSEGSNKNVITVPEAGYYLIDAVTVPHDGAYTEYILQVVGDLEMAAKEDIPTSDKHIFDNGSEEASETDSAVFAVGDTVNFELKGTVSAYYKDFVNENGDGFYTMTFHDTMTSGLTLNKDITIFIVADGEEYEIDQSACADYVSVSKSTATGVLGDGCTFEVTITNLAGLLDKMGIDGFNAKDAENNYVKVTCSATLDSGALIGNGEEDGLGNVNTLTMDFSNDVYNEEHYETTPPDQVRALTLQLTVNKTDGNDSLEGAAFALYKLNSGNEYVLVAGIANGGSDGATFNWKGLDEGQYKIVETQTPAGYNTANDLEFVINAETDWSQGFTYLVIKDLDGNTIGSSNYDDLEDNVPDFTVDLSTGGLSVTIENHEGASLPGTGGIGTTIFYVLGAILVCGAAVVLVTRRRVNGKAGNTRG